ncbi:MAG: valine--tRNA ligase, partial [Tannerellaceae bacterium]|nr:valine--tRNA ligase [Tannerellaceae bacterium]
LWQALESRNNDGGVSIMTAQMPQTGPADDAYLKSFETVKEIIGGIRTVRLRRNIPAKEMLNLLCAGNHDDAFNPVTEKIGLVTFDSPAEDTASKVSFLVGTTEYAIPLLRKIDTEEELSKLNAELLYQQGFLDIVVRKLNNANFVDKAPANVIEAERRKQADAESKIKSIQEAIAALS